MFKFQEIIEDAGFKTRSYSGRGMYGRNCLGVDLKQYQHEGELFAALIREMVDTDADHDAFCQLADTIEDYSTDSRGLGSIIYWPNIPYQASDNDAEQDEECPECQANEWVDGECQNCGFAPDSD